MKYACLKCDQKWDTYAEARAHSESTYHPYRKVMVDALDLENTRLFDFLAMRYTEQVKYATKLFNRIVQNINTEYQDRETQMQFQITIFSEILDKVLTPAVYLGQELPAEKEKEKEKEKENEKDKEKDKEKGGANK